MGRSAFLSSVLVALLVSGCAGSDLAAPITEPVDTGVDTSTERDTAVAPDALADGAKPDVAVDGTTDGTVSDAAVDGTVDALSDTGASDDTSTVGDSTVKLDTGPWDTGAVVITDAVIPDGIGDEFATDTGPWPDASPTLVPINKPCTASAECDPTGAKVGICSNSYFPPDSLDPSPVCMALACESGAAGINKPCGLGGAGLCVGGGTAGRCLPGCSFGSTGAATGCVGKNACRQYTWERVSGTVKGLGYCTGGCAADADCSAGQKCQKEDGYCVSTLVTYTKTLGATCTSSSECPCKLNGSTGLGYCVKFCKTGDATATCPSGFTCDPNLPASDATGALFSGVATGMSGTCYKNCTSDTECTPLGGHCEANTATGVKVCQVP